MCRNCAALTQWIMFSTAKLFLLGINILQYLCVNEISNKTKSLGTVKTKDHQSKHSKKWIILLQSSRLRILPIYFTMVMNAKSCVLSTV